MGSVFSHICGRNQLKQPSKTLLEEPHIQSIHNSRVQIDSEQLQLKDLVAMKRSVAGSSNSLPEESTNENDNKRQKTDDLKFALKEFASKTLTKSQDRIAVADSDTRDKLCMQNKTLNSNHNICCCVEKVKHVVNESGDSQENSVNECECLNNEQNKASGEEYTSINNAVTSSAYNINDLPSTLLVHIFHQLSLQDILHRVSLVCKQWHNLCCDAVLWRNINLKGQLKVDDALLLRLTSYSGNVTTLDLTDVRLTTNEGMASTLRQCSQIQSLSLVRCMHLTDYAFQSVGEFCHKLRRLKLDCCSALTDQSLVKISNGCPMLDRLWLNQCGGITDVGLIALAHGCPKLELLALEQCREITDNSLIALTEKCKDIRRLSFMNNSFTANGIDSLAKLKNLEELEVTQVTSISDDNVIHIVRNCKRLVCLNVSLCTQISDRSVAYIAKHAQNIRSLYLVACKLTDEAMFSLSKCPSLEKLDVGWCTEITVAGAESVSEGCKGLQYLGLMRCDAVARDASESLVERFPGITYSTMWLECERLLARARNAGYCTV